MVGTSKLGSWNGHWWDESSIEMGLDHCLWTAKQRREVITTVISHPKTRTCHPNWCHPCPHNPRYSDSNTIIATTYFDVDLWKRWDSKYIGFRETHTQPFWTLFGAPSDQKGWNHKLRTDINKAINKSTQELLCPGKWWSYHHISMFICEHFHTRTLSL